MKDENDLYWVWLATRMGIASKEFGKLIGMIPDPYDIYRLSEEEIEQLGFGARTKKNLCDKSLTEAYAILKYCKSAKVEIIGYTDKKYPARLRAIEDPPVLLYCKGKMPDMNAKLCVGMVGTRKMSEYGMQTAYKISYELSAAGACVVSGMALGIDGVCACGAIEGGGTTVAVLGCGIARVYPKAHAVLSKAICSHGAVITEYPPSEEPHGYNFPKRNRIISGLCQGVVIVEGAKGSGALITATRAIEQGRELFALPGKVNESNSDGPNELIRNGANVVLCAEDIIDHYDFLYHDTLNFKAYLRAKKTSDINEKSLSRYGVSAVCESVRSMSVTEAPTHDEKASAPKTEAVNEKKEEQETTEVKSDLSALRTLDEKTRNIYGMLSDTVFTADDIAAKGVAIHRVMTALTMLEVSGLITSLPGGSFKKL